MSNVGKNMKKNVIIASLFFVALSANAEGFDLGQAVNASIEVKAAETNQTTKNSETYVITVPSGGFIENAIMLTSIKSGSGSNAIDALVSMLKSDTPRNIAVIGNNKAIVAASIESAIKEMKSAPSVSTIFFSGEKKYCDEINLLAKNTGIQVTTSITN